MLTTPTEPRKLLLTGPHVDRLLTLLAWLTVVENPVEHDRYWRQITLLRRAHPELAEITETDPRVETRAMEIRADLETDERRGDYDDVVEGWAGSR